MDDTKKLYLKKDVLQILGLSESEYNDLTRKRPNGGPPFFANEKRKAQGRGNKFVHTEEDLLLLSVLNKLKESRISRSMSDLIRKQIYELQSENLVLTVNEHVYITISVGEIKKQIENAINSVNN